MPLRNSAVNLHSNLFRMLLSSSWHRKETLGVNPDNWKADVLLIYRLLLIYARIFVLKEEYDFHNQYNPSSERS